MARDARPPLGVCPWNATDTFNAETFVSWQNYIYRAQVANQNKPPDTNSDVWYKYQAPPGPKGDKGDKGDAATIASVSATALAYGAAPTATNTGTANEAKLLFGLPASEGTTRRVVLGIPVPAVTVSLQAQVGTSVLGASLYAGAITITCTFPEFPDSTVLYRAIPSFRKIGTGFVGLPVAVVRPGQTKNSVAFDVTVKDFNLLANTLVMDVVIIRDP